MRSRQHPWGTESALKSVVLSERRLERREPLDRTQTFHCRNLETISLDRQHQAGTHCIPVHDDGASAAYAMLAAHVRPGEAEAVTQAVDERCPHGNLDSGRTPVQSKADDSIHGFA